MQQTYRPIQYIYVDDGSTDGTAEVVEAYRDRFASEDIDFTFIRQSNTGLCGALMTGFQYVRGEFLSNPEYDDYLLPCSVEQRVISLKENPDCAVAVADAWCVKEDDLECRSELLSKHSTDKFNPFHFQHCLVGNTIFNAACYLVRMDRFDMTHPGRKIYEYAYGSNQQILLPLYYHWKRVFIEEPLSVRVLRTTSLSVEPNMLDYEIKRESQYRDMLFSVIDGIQMSSTEREKYKQIVDINVHRDYLNYARKYGSRALWKEGYDYLKNHHALPSVLPPFHPNLFTSKKILSLIRKLIRRIQ